MFGQFFARKSIVKNGKQGYIVAGMIFLDENQEDLIMKPESMFLANFTPLVTLQDISHHSRGKTIDGIYQLPLWRVPKNKKEK